MGIENLERVLDQASDQDIKVAQEAWFRYQRIVAGIAGQYGFTTTIGAAVFAALSPNNDYFGNLRDTARLLAHASAGQDIDSFKVSTYGNNKRKAWQIALGAHPLDLIIAPKTRNFFLNVADPTDNRPVTVDGHIFNAWAGERVPLNSVALKLRGDRYEAVANGVRQLGAAHNVIPNVIQGTIWYTWKRLHRIHHAAQLEFWKSDHITAGLGFELES